MKTCSTCNLEKPLTEFTKCSSNKDGLNGHCKSCAKTYRLSRKDYMKDYQIKHKHTLTNYRKEYRSNNKALITETRRTHTKNNWERKMLKHSYDSAKKRNLEHTITINDIVIPDVCPLLDVPLTRILGKGRVPTNASLDRIDSAKGYTPDNIQVISYLANVMKNNATEEQLVEFAINILRLHDT